MRPLVFIPGPIPDRSPKEHFAAVGLDEIATGVDVKQVPGGPDNQPNGGLLFSWTSPEQAQFDYFPDRQKWVPSLELGDRKPGAYWIGFWNDNPPTEKDLRRPDHRPGAEVLLGNGELWTIPTPDSPERFAKFLGNGKVEWVVDARYNWLATDLKKREQHGLLNRGSKDEGDTPFFIYDDEHDAEFLARLMQINYRITMEVMNELELLPRSSVRAIIAGMMGMELKG